MLPARVVPHAFSLSRLQVLTEKWNAALGLSLLAMLAGSKRAEVDEDRPRFLVVSKDTEESNASGRLAKRLFLGACEPQQWPSTSPTSDARDRQFYDQQAVIEYDEFIGQVWVCSENSGCPHAAVAVSLWAMFCCRRSTASGLPAVPCRKDVGRVRSSIPGLGRLLAASPACLPTIASAATMRHGGADGRLLGRRGGSRQRNAWFDPAAQNVQRRRTCLADRRLQEA